MMKFREENYHIEKTNPKWNYNRAGICIFAVLLDEKTC